MSSTVLSYQQTGARCAFVKKPKKWRGVGAWEKNGWEVCGRQEKREREVGFSTWGEVGEIGKIMQQYTIFCNQNRAKRQEPTEIGWEPGLEGMGSGKLKPPVFPSPPTPTTTKPLVKLKIWTTHS